MAISQDGSIRLTSTTLATSLPTGGSELQAKLGWVSQPNQRGTLDIIWSCVVTLGICVWAMLHLNVPAESDSQITLFLRRARWMVLAILAPELVLLYAGGQWTSAKRSVAAMQELGYGRWTMVHAFYADSGGFLLHAEDTIAFPVTAKQIHYLVQKGHLAMPKVTKKEIWDKSKADRLAKTIAASQAAWLAAQVIARGMQHLPITLIELSTVALITCTGATAFFWFQKPLGVETPTGLYLDTTIAQVLKLAGDEAKAPFADTPMDFIESRIYTSSQMPLRQYWGVQERPLPRIPNDRDPRLHNLNMILIVSIPTAAFSLLHLIGWHFDFPTEAELLLWRWTCVSMTILLGTYCATEAASIIAEGYTTTGLTTLKGYKLRWPTNTLFFVPGFLYMCARMIVLVEIVISLRLLPVGCFETVQWTQLIPHF